MTERPILFSAPMVRAILEGRKTQTRRLVYTVRHIAGDKPVPRSAVEFLRDYPPPWLDPFEYACLGRWHTIKPGDTLWVREAFYPAYRATATNPGVIYLADADEFCGGFARGAHRWASDTVKWKPSIHMPRIASRITLKVTAARIERLQDISEADCVAEGPPAAGRDGPFGTVVIPDLTKPHIRATPRNWYRNLWSDLHGALSWDRNPWVVVIAFEVVKR